MEERYLSLAEACEVLGKSERTLYRWIKSGKLKAYKPGRDYEIPESAIREMRERSEVYPKAQAPPSPEQPSLNGLLEEERRRPEYLREQLAAHHIEVSSSEAIVLAQYLEVEENPPEDTYVIAHVVKEDEPVDHDHIARLLTYVVAHILTDEERVALGEARRRELVAA